MSAPGLFARYSGNPILGAADIPYRANSVFNAGALAYTAYSRRGPLVSLAVILAIRRHAGRDSAAMSRSNP